MKNYTKQDYEEDLEWLRGLGCDTEEIEPFIINLIKKGFCMSRKELLTFLSEVTK